MKTIQMSPGMKRYIPIVFGQFFSMVGSILSTLALGIWVYQETGSVTQYALITAFTNLPGFLISPLAGAIVDRWDRRKLILLSESVLCVSSLALALLFWAGQLELWQIYLCATINSIGLAFIRSAYSAIVSLLVPKEDLGRANGLYQAAVGGAQIISPVLAGALVSTVGILSALWIDFASFFFPIAVMLTIRIPRIDHGESDKTGSSLWKDAAYSWHYVSTRPGILGIILLSGIFSFFTGLVTVLFTPLMLSFSTPTMMGTLISFGGLGMLVGSVVMGIWGGPKRRVFGMLAFAFGCGAFITLVGLRESIPLIAGGVFMYFFCYPICIGCTQVILQSKVPLDVQGRVFALSGMLSTAAVPLASILSGPLADKIFEPAMAKAGSLASSIGQITGAGPGRGIGLLFIITGLLTMLMALGFYLYPRLRHIEKELPDMVIHKELAY